MGQELQPYLSLRESITSVFKKRNTSNSPYRIKEISPQLNKTDIQRGRQGKDFWALRDVNFDVYPGDSLAIIGRNGAGKTTLLKILSKITPPTQGKIICRGRVASLLEVGTGFHPELTGNENIFLNGSILGLTKREINEKFDEIVDFSGVEKFLDTPLKRYSSGMQLRLAFSVAAHLEPEILMIDEVLAVGDSVFQQKCIEKMSDISRSGRTILFVSHNFSAVKALCNNAIVLEEGQKVFEGGVNDAIDFYNAHSRLSGRVIDLAAVPRSKHARELLFNKIIFEKEKIYFGEKIRFNIKLKSNGDIKEFPDLDFGITIRDKNNNALIHLSNRFINKYFDHSNDDIQYVFQCSNNLKPGIYGMNIFLRSKDVIQDWLTDVLEFTIEDGNPYNYSNTQNIYGATLPEFSIEKKG